LQLIERREERRHSQYRWVLRTRPDVYVSCTLRHPRLDVGIPSTPLPTKWVAFAWDYLAFMTREAATVSLNQSSLGRSISSCQPEYHTVAHCNACLMKLHGFQTDVVSSQVHDGVWASVDVVRSCQLLSDERMRRKCSGFGVPYMATSAKDSCPAWRLWARPIGGIRAHMPWWGLENECRYIQRKHYTVHRSTGRRWSRSRGQ
jgi:hypothetical protein